MPLFFALNSRDHYLNEESIFLKLCSQQSLCRILCGSVDRLHICLNKLNMAVTIRVCVFLILVCGLMNCQSPIRPLRDLPRSIPRFDVWSSIDKPFKGYIQLRKFTDPGVQIMINSSGEVVWYSMVNTTLFRPFTPLDDRYLSLQDDKTIYEITYSGDTTLALFFGQKGFDKPLHHEVIYDGDNIAALTKEELSIDSDSLPNDKKNVIVTDGIIVLSRDGDKVWSWNIGDVLDPQADPEILKSLKDWGHANSLALDLDGNYLISWRNFNEVWKVDRENGQLIWRYGNSQLQDSSQMFYGQHSLHVNNEGEYLLLDNGHKTHRSSSRALGFKYNEGTGFDQTLSISLPDSLFTSKMGSVYQFEEDRYLFCSPMSNALLVTNREGEILWYAKSDFQYYRAYYMEEIDL